ncbi:hypothetical protein LTR97_005706 [Elasticomyces elasticus]|uniref:AB hydrolase-1 domain-containing protein n=1 Tax=Elasticomyces elasticus TaxID=574655 RepID=A0AAN7ZTX3_9PEZI|nr:hypothetical protein LTR97_005706 [Elasticomyces elasticus]
MAGELQDVRMSDGVVLKAKIIGNDSTKVLLLAPHGGPGLSTYKEPEAAYSAFSDKFRILLFDARGSGQSDKKGPLTHARWVDDMEELRQWADADKMILIGGSHAGFLTLEYALTYPEHLHAIIVGDTAAQMSHWGLMNAVKTALVDPRTKDLVDPEQVLRMMSGRLRDFDDLATGFGTISALYAAPPDLKAQSETDVDAVLQTTMFPVLETCNAAMGYCLSRYDVRDRLHEIRIPTMVYVGRHDWITPPSVGKAVADGILGAKFVVYEKSGHFAALEEKTKFRADVLQFLQESGVPGRC